MNEPMTNLHHMTEGMGEQLNKMEVEQFEFNFDGPKIEAQDAKRLGKQFKSVLSVMRDGKWRSDAQIAEDAGFKASQVGSISARRRDFRKSKFWPAMGVESAEVESRKAGEGFYEYRLIMKGATCQK